MISTTMRMVTLMALLVLSTPSVEMEEAVGGGEEGSRSHDHDVMLSMGDAARPSITVAFPLDGEAFEEGHDGFFEVLVSGLEGTAMGNEATGRLLLHLELDGARIAEASMDQLIARGGVVSAELRGLSAGVRVLSALFAGDDVSRRSVRIRVGSGGEQGLTIGGAGGGQAKGIRDAGKNVWGGKGIPLPLVVVPPGDVEGWADGWAIRIVSPAKNSVLRAQDEDHGALLNIEVEAVASECGDGGDAYLLVAVDGVQVMASGGCKAAVQIEGLRLGTHIVTASLHAKGGEQILGGQGCGSCVSPFKVDVRVWDEAEMRPRDEVGRGEGDALLDLDLSGVFTWSGVMDAYADFHSRALKAPPGTVALYIYTPRDCGMGNRMIDLASSYLAALLSRRILVVNWTAPVPLWYFIKSNLTLFPDSPIVAPHLKAGISNDTTFYMTEASLRDPRPLSTLIGCGLGWGGMVEYQIGPVLRAIYGDVSYTSSKEFGLLHPELGIAIGDILKGLMIPSPMVEAAIGIRLARGGEAPSGYTVGVHARVTMSSSASGGGDSQIGPLSATPLRSRGQAMLALTALAVMREAPPEASLFLSTDSEALRDAWKAQSVLGERLLSSHDGVRHTAREEGVMGHMGAFADWWALSRCDALVLTRQSTFGYTAAGMAGIVPLTVFEHKVERRFHCGPFELCDMQPPEMGI